MPVDERRIAANTAAKQRPCRGLTLLYRIGTATGHRLCLIPGADVSRCVVTLLYNLSIDCYYEYVRKTVEGVTLLLNSSRLRGA